MTQTTVQNKLSNLSIDILAEMWEMTEKQITNWEMYTVRGWLMDEFQRRDPKNFERWINDEVQLSAIGR